MNNIDKQYQQLLQDIIDNGVKKSTRNGDTISVFGRQIRHKMSEGFPLLTTKKMFWKGIVVELLWFLRGETNIKYLLENSCNIWVGDCYRAYLEEVNENGTKHIGDVKEYDTIGNDEWPVVTPFTKEEFINKIKTDDKFANIWGELGPIYGKQWRSWRADYSSFFEEYNYVDQIQNLINDIKTNPDSRRLMVNAWNVGELDNMVLPPCHYGFQVYTRELSLEERWELAKIKGIIKADSKLPNNDVYLGIKAHDEINSLLSDTTIGNNIPTRAISLMWNQRSVDTFLGLPFNIASYALLLEILAKTVNMVPEELIGNLGDVHLYSEHVDAAKEQISREPYDLPSLIHGKTDAFYKSLGEDISLITHLDPDNFSLSNYQSHLSIKAELKN